MTRLSKALPTPEQPAHPYAMWRLGWMVNGRYVSVLRGMNESQEEMEKAGSGLAQSPWKRPVTLERVEVALVREWPASG